MSNIMHHYYENMDKIMEQIQKGAFLTVKSGEKINTMTIGWATIGIMWNKPIMVIAVRDSRYTYDLINNAKDFSVSIPMTDHLKKELIICGTKSGKDINKFTETGLNILEGRSIESPIVADCELYYECKIVYSQLMDAALLDPMIDKTSYPKKDYHKIYYGEIVECY